MIYYIISAIIIFLIIVYLCFKKQIDFFIIANSGKKRIQKKLYNACKINNYLIMSDLSLPIENNRYKKVDTIIIGNKYIYITKQIIGKGTLISKNDDSKWRLIDNDKLTNIDNPYSYNDRIINKLSNVIDNEYNNRIINLVVVTNIISPEGDININNNHFVIKENDVIRFIENIENNSPLENLDYETQENIAMVFYKAGMKSQKIIDNNK